MPTPDLVARARAGDPAAYAEIVAGCQDRLYRVAMAFTRDVNDARDVIQEALIAGWRALPTLEDDARVDGWLCRITVNQARMFLRARRRRPTVDIEPFLPMFEADGHRIGEVRAWAVKPDDALERRRLAERIDAFAAELPEMYREVWVLADVEQLSMQEVADVLGLSVPNVKTRLHRARLTLRERLAREVERR